MVLNRAKLVATTALIAIASPTIAAPSDDLAAILKDHWQWSLSESPIMASSMGVAGYEGKVGELSLSAMDKSAKTAQGFLDRLNALPIDQLSPSERTNALILKRSLSDQIEGNKHPQRIMLFTTYYGWHQGYAGLGDNSPLRNKVDYQSYLDRIAQYPKINDEALKITQMAVDQGQVLPCEVLGNSAKGIIGVVNEDPTKSRFYSPFTRTKPADMTATEWSAMQDKAKNLITTVINPAYRKHHDFFTNTYLKKCAKDPAITKLPGGKDYYAFRIRQETTTDLSADQIHAIGLNEVKRIRAEMEGVAKKAGFASREAFIADLRTNPQYYAKSPEELMRYAAREAKRIDGFMPTLFHKLPRLPYGIKDIPAEIAEGTTTAYYNPGSPQSGIAGNYYVNTSKLDQRPLYELPALTAHESVPGHHNQIALQQELDIPEFRQNIGFTAFTEGWGLYSERLGIEMGIYDTPAKDMGRLSYEMWRACRLVVDTGIHSKGWTKAQAIKFMKDNSALSEANIEAEVNRYISWPGQALGYKIGEIKIRELRALAEKELGAKFDLAAFHDTVLGQGAVPLDVLELQVKDWIAKVKAT